VWLRNCNPLRLRFPGVCAMIAIMQKGSVPPSGEANGHDLISLAQKLARDAEHHALLSASLASQADRLMLAGLEKLRETHAPVLTPRASRTPRNSC
jgi:hypothetical protein